MDMGADEVIARRAQMGSGRSSFEAHWQDIIAYMRPDAPSPYLTRGSAGEKTRGQMLDSSGEMALELLAAALHGSLTNPATDWLLLRAEDESLNDRDDVALAVEDATRKMLIAYNSPGAHFAPTIHETYLDLVGFGIGHLFMADREVNHEIPVMFQARPVSEMFVAENAQGQVDTWMRDFEMTARQAASEKSWKLGPVLNRAAADPRKQDETFQFLQMIAPRSDRAYGRGDRSNMPWRNCIVSVTDGTIVYEGGFEEAPLVSPRWSKRAGEIYGRGPGMKALPDVKMLQRIARATIRGAEKTIDPPLMVADDGVASPIRLTSGALNTVRYDLLGQTGAPIRPIITDARVDIGIEFVKHVQGRVEMAFYSHLIQINQDYRMTATQVLEISQRTMQALGPMLGRIQSELLGPMVSRTFNIMARAGWFAFPESLRDQPLKIEFVSPIVRAQKVNEANDILRALAAGQQIAAGGSPEVMDIFDLDGHARRLADLYGSPKSLIRTDEKVAEIRAARNQVTSEAAGRQQMQQMAETAAAGAGAVKDLAAVAPAGTA